DGEFQGAFKASDLTQLHDNLLKAIGRFPPLDNVAPPQLKQRLLGIVADLIFKVRQLEEAPRTTLITSPADVARRIQGGGLQLASEGNGSPEQPDSGTLENTDPFALPSNDAEKQSENNAENQSQDAIARLVKALQPQNEAALFDIWKNNKPLEAMCKIYALRQ